jgi:hypothetical protein
MVGVLPDQFREYQKAFIILFHGGVLTDQFREHQNALIIFVTKFPPWPVSSPTS